MKAEIGETAGQIWRLLDREGPQTLAQIKKKLGAKPAYMDYALGWLAREDRINFTPEKRTYKVSLK
ncbi:MAG: winged helix-turn-helix domain-containing protein [Acidobacteria bacterium]|nr:winged helix-turn-helix domain-containing protein [Acidobacteriota bacterium]